MCTQGNRLRKIRNELHLTQTEFGKKLGMSKQHFSKAENDVVVLNNEKLVALGCYFNVNLNYFLLGNGVMFTDKEEKAKKGIGDIIEDLISEKLNEKLKDMGL